MLAQTVLTPSTPHLSDDLGIPFIYLQAGTQSHLNSYDLGRSQGSKLSLSSPPLFVETCKLKLSKSKGKRCTVLMHCLCQWRFMNGWMCPRIIRSCQIVTFCRHKIQIFYSEGVGFTKLMQDFRVCQKMIRICHLYSVKMLTYQYISVFLKIPFLIKIWYHNHFRRSWADSQKSNEHMN